MQIDHRSLNASDPTSMSPVLPEVLYSIEGGRRIPWYVLAEDGEAWVVSRHIEGSFRRSVSKADLLTWEDVRDFG